MSLSKRIQYDNASQRIRASSHIFNIGAREAKERVLDRLDNKYTNLHREGKIHIHDLENYIFGFLYLVDLVIIIVRQVRKHKHRPVTE